MSGLEKHQSNPTSRQRWLHNLLSDRPRPVIPKTHDDIFDRRCSIDILLDFPALIKAKKAELAKQTCEENNKEILATNIQSESENMYKVEKTTLNQEGDDSFDAFERMCDKTGSDPDSTLFQYLHSDNKDQVLALAKERSMQSDKSSDLELDALRRMFSEVCEQDQIDNESPLKSIECTQLEDIEAPSRLWDNDCTINSNDSMFAPLVKTSPVKMVGLMRPSTILEANEADLSGMISDGESSFNSSFKTAGTLKTARSYDTIESGSSCYETAADSSLASSSKEGATTLNVDDLFYAAIAKAKPHGISKAEEEELLNDMHETLMDSLVGANECQTVGSDAADNTIIELSSSSDEEIDLSVDIKQEVIKESVDDDKENKSMHFNDTIEEMEYMMQKGLDLMAAQTSPIKPQTTLNLPKQNTFVMTPEKTPLTPLQQSSAKTLTASSKNTRHIINMDQPRSKFFKQPTGIPIRRHLNLQKDQFAHIVSPIRAYTHNSATAPLMSMFRQTQNITDCCNTLSAKELEQESRLCQMLRAQAGIVNPLKKDIDGIDPTAQLLPKKAYISSELKQVVDERTPLPMPNVSKIQKYLNSAMEPSVLRHDGKIKMPDGKNASHIPRRPNQSLADLSLASGDISLYTIKDAQKF